MNLQWLADWGMTEVSNKRIRVLLGYLLPAGMQIWQVGSTVEPGAHPSRRVFGRRGTWRAQSDKPHHFLVLTQKASLIPGSTAQTTPDQNRQWLAKDGTLISATKLLGLIGFWLYRKKRCEQGNKSVASSLHWSPYRESDSDCQSLAARKLRIKQATWQRGFWDAFPSFNPLTSKSQVSSFCDTAFVSTGICWLTGCEWISSNSYQHTEILAGQAAREAAEGTYPTLNALRLWFWLYS